MGPLPSSSAKSLSLLELQDSVDGRASLFTGEEEVFAAQRVVSRLTEMQTSGYWDRAVHEWRRGSPSY